MGEDLDVVVGLSIAVFVAGVCLHHWISRVAERRAWRRLQRERKDGSWS